MLFLAVNILLILAIFSVLFFNGGLDGSFPVDELSEHISNRDGLLSSDTVGSPAARVACKAARRGPPGAFVLSDVSVS